MSQPLNKQLVRDFHTAMKKKTNQNTPRDYQQLNTELMSKPSSSQPVTSTPNIHSTKFSASRALYDIVEKIQKRFNTIIILEFRDRERFNLLPYEKRILRTNEFLNNSLLDSEIQSICRALENMGLIEGAKYGDKLKNILPEALTEVLQSSLNESTLSHAIASHIKVRYGGGKKKLIGGFFDLFRKQPPKIPIIQEVDPILLQTTYVRKDTPNDTKKGESDGKEPPSDEKSAIEKSTVVVPIVGQTVMAGQLNDELLSNTPENHSQIGGNMKIRSKSKTSNHIVIKNRKYIVYEGPRGGKYVRKNNCWIHIKK